MNLFEMFGGDGKRPVETPPIALTIAGSDSGGGAGIQADLKTFAVCEVHGTSVITLVTAQNTVGVRRVHVLPDDIVRAQLAAVLDDLPPDAAKTGALGSERMIALIAEALTEREIAQLVVDPVMVSKHGDSLLPDAAIKAMRERMLPLALLVTPNRFEAGALTKRTVEGPGSMKDAAKALFDCGARNVLIKGAHLDRIVRDIFYDGSGFVEFGADRIHSERVHGSGCVHSAAITARLARGEELLESIAWAREFISSAIEYAPALGDGVSPVNPMFKSWTSAEPQT